MVIIVSVIVLIRHIKLFFQSFGGSIDDFLKKRSGRLVVLNKEEDNAVEAYCLWQHERGVNLDTAKSQSKVVKKARIVTSEEVMKEIVEIESRKRSKMPRSHLKKLKKASDGRRRKRPKKAAMSRLLV